MTRQERAREVIKAIKEMGMTYEVLNENGSTPNHLRINGFGDVWPSTGTFKQNGKMYKKSYKLLLQRLTGRAENPMDTETAKPNKQRITELEEKICFLEQQMEYLLERIG